MELIALGRAGRGSVAEADVEPEVVADVHCALCGNGEGVTWVAVGHEDAVVCLDSADCVRRALGVRV